MGAIIEGISWGLLLSIMAGPIFFAILQASVEQGSRAGISVAAGQWLGDFMLISIAIWASDFTRDVLNEPEVQEQVVRYVGSIGSILLALLGLANWVLPAPKIKEDVLQHKGSNAKLFVKGWAINTINPGPLIFWMMLMGTALVRNYSTVEIVLLFSAVMGIVIVTDFIKVYLAKQIRKRISEKSLLWIRRIAGTALLVFAALLAIKVIQSI